LEALARQHGLLHDPITTDAARVLRVPDTFNKKQVPHKPVGILLLEADLSFASALSHLLKPNAEEPPPAGAPEELPPDEFKRDEYDFPPLPFKPIQEGCPFFADAYETHGKEHAQSLWHLMILATTFLEDGERLAHELGNAHPAYTPEETQGMWDRKVREREELDLGWPGCQAFESAGCTFCKTCQHHGKIKSPLNLAVPVIIKNASDRILEEVKDEKIDPVVALKKLHRMGADNETMFSVLNANYAVVKYGSETLVASVIGNDVTVMKVHDFHNIFANVRVQEGRRFVEISKVWFNWPGRRHYMRRGIVFEPGGKLDIPDDMLNLWRGFGIEPKPGDCHSCEIIFLMSSAPGTRHTLIIWSDGWPTPSNDRTSLSALRLLCEARKGRVRALSPAP
jgi:large-conductance mechanosensitive channel